MRTKKRKLKRNFGSGEPIIGFMFMATPEIPALTPKWLKNPVRILENGKVQAMYEYST